MIPSAAAGGALEENAGEAVIGAVDDAQRVTRRIEDIEEELLQRRSAEEQGLADAQLAELGRTEEQMQPFVKKIVEEEWYETLESLREVSDAQWKQWGVPRRLSDKLKEKLGTPMSAAGGMGAAASAPPRCAETACAR